MESYFYSFWMFKGEYTVYGHIYEFMEYTVLYGFFFMILFNHIGIYLVILKSIL